MDLMQKYVYGRRFHQKEKQSAHLIQIGRNNLILDMVLFGQNQFLLAYIS